MILRARTVLPLARPPFEDGAIVISGNRIAAVGPWRQLRRRSQPMLDLGEVVLLPGLINAHCHLDYTNMAGQFHAPKMFIDWLKLITATKAGWTYADYQQSWTAGAQMLLRSGTTTVADIEAVPELLPQAWAATPLRVISFLEMIGITGRRTSAAILQEVLDRVDSWPHGRERVGLSPHAPYSTLPSLLRLSGAAARQRGWRIAVHVAESALEYEMLTQGRGLMFDWLRRSGRDMSDCGLGSPVQHLERCGLLGENLVAVHANYLRKADATLLARRGTHVAHCPRSHAYFGHAPFPLNRLRRAGVNVCLGTDSLASVYKRRRQTIELDGFEEMRCLAQADPAQSPRALLHMATLNGARALGLQGEAGELSKGALADLIALPFSGRLSGVYDTVLAHSGPVLASMIDGRWALGPGSN